MSLHSNSFLAETAASAPLHAETRETSADIIRFPAPRRMPRALPKLELLTALFGAIGLAGGTASSEALVAIVSGALPERSEEAVRAEVEALLAFYSRADDGATGELRIFEQRVDGRYVLSDTVRGFLA